MRILNVKTRLGKSTVSVPTDAKFISVVKHSEGIRLQLITNYGDAITEISKVDKKILTVSDNHSVDIDLINDYQHIGVVELGVFTYNVFCEK